MYITGKASNIWNIPHNRNIETIHRGLLDCIVEIRYENRTIWNKQSGIALLCNEHLRRDDPSTTASTIM